jgi:hypothetical protein
VLVLHVADLRLLLAAAHVYSWPRAMQGSCVAGNTRCIACVAVSCVGVLRVTFACICQQVQCTELLLHVPVSCACVEGLMVWVTLYAMHRYPVPAAAVDTHQGQ